jgi:hypothetical protein
MASSDEPLMLLSRQQGSSVRGQGFTNACEQSGRFVKQLT